MRKKSKVDLASYMFILPAMIIYLSVIAIPVVYTFYISAFKWNGIAAKEFVGIQNYINLFTKDPIFLISIKNNLLWIFLTLIVTVSMSLGFAILINKPFKGRTFFRGVYYLPSVLAAISVSVTWRWIYNPNFGFVNEFLRVLGLDNLSQTWLSQPKAAIFAIFGASLWQGIGQPMILFLAGLQTVPEDVQEAATIDGAGRFRRFIHVTVPLLKETFVIVIATLVISAMKVYDIVVGLTGGGPNNSTQMLSTYMNLHTFMYSNVGTGATIASIMVLMMALVIIPYVSFTAKEHH
jgi:ABC-type sugar transport system permease subunit